MAVTAAYTAMDEDTSSGEEDSESEEEDGEGLTIPLGEDEEWDEVFA